MVAKCDAVGPGRAIARIDYQLALDLDAMTVTAPGGAVLFFQMESAQRRMLMEGLDTIGLTLTLRPEIEAFRERDRKERPWVYL